MSLITLVMLIALSLLYLTRWSKRKENDPLFNLVNKSDGYLTKFDDFLRRTIHCDALTAFLIYTIAAALLTLVMPMDVQEILIRFFANVVAALMILPFVVEKAVVKYKDKVNAAILQEMANLAGWVVRNEKYFTFVGGGFAALLFFVLFR